MKLEEVSKELPILAPNIVIISDLDIVALGSIDVILPPFKPVSFLDQSNLCNILELPLTNPVFSKLNCTNSCNNEEFNELESSISILISGDGNCLFSSLSYLITESTCCNQLIRKIITKTIVGRLSPLCLCLFRVDFLSTYRNTNKYISKSNMNKDKTWGGDI